MKKELVEVYLKNENKIRHRLPAAVAIVLFLINFVLLMIIPFMYATLIEPMPLYENALRTMNTFTLANFLNFSIMGIVAYVLSRNI